MRTCAARYLVHPDADDPEESSLPCRARAPRCLTAKMTVNTTPGKAAKAPNAPQFIASEIPAARRDALRAGSGSPVENATTTLTTLPRNASARVSRTIALSRTFALPTSCARRARSPFTANHAANRLSTTAAAMIATLMSCVRDLCCCSWNRTVTLSFKWSSGKLAALYHDLEARAMGQLYMLGLTPAINQRALARRGVDERKRGICSRRDDCARLLPVTRGRLCR